MVATLRATAVQRELELYTAKLRNHPISYFCKTAELPRSVLDAFARAQLVDNIYWVTMLARVRDQLESPVLREAVRKNILDEVGDSKTSHVTLCKQFVESLGLPSHFDDYRHYSPASVYPVELMMSLAGNVDDGFMAGWLLAQECLVPVLFQMFRPSFEAIPGADVSYLKEHEQVDACDHTRWLMEGIQSIAITDETVARVVTGLDLGGRATLAVPDCLYAQTIKHRL
jgi:pyrroloquinoline quinone (PQQ) biosynthesis protein C